MTAVATDESAHAVDDRRTTRRLLLPGVLAVLLVGVIAGLFLGRGMSSPAAPSTNYVDVGFARVRAARMSYVGGSGFELYVPVEMARHVYLALMGAGHDLGLRDAGYYALDALRIACSSSFSLSTRRIPLPPPPAEAFSNTG